MQGTNTVEVKTMFFSLWSLHIYETKACHQQQATSPEASMNFWIYQSKCADGESTSTLNGKTLQSAISLVSSQRSARTSIVGWKLNPAP